MEKITQTHLGRIKVRNLNIFGFFDTTNPSGTFLRRCSWNDEFRKYYFRKNRVIIFDFDIVQFALVNMLSPKFCISMFARMSCACKFRCNIFHHDNMSRIIFDTISKRSGMILEQFTMDIPRDELRGFLSARHIMTNTDLTDSQN